MTVCSVNLHVGRNNCVTGDFLALKKVFLFCELSLILQSQERW